MKKYKKNLPKLAVCVVLTLVFLAAALSLLETIFFSPADPTEISEKAITWFFIFIIGFFVFLVMTIIVLYYLLEKLQ